MLEKLTNHMLLLHRRSSDGSIGVPDDIKAAVLLPTLLHFFFFVINIAGMMNALKRTDVPVKEQYHKQYFPGLYRVIFSASGFLFQLLMALRVTMLHLYGAEFATALVLMLGPASASFICSSLYYYSTLGTMIVTAESMMRPGQLASNTYMLEKTQTRTRFPKWFPTWGVGFVWCIIVLVHAGLAYKTYNEQNLYDLANYPFAAINIDIAYGFYVILAVTNLIVMVKLGFIFPLLLVEAALICVVFILFVLIALLSVYAWETPTLQGTDYAFKLLATFLGMTSNACFWPAAQIEYKQWLEWLKKCGRVLMILLWICSCGTISTDIKALKQERTDDHDHEDFQLVRQKFEKGKQKAHHHEEDNSLFNDTGSIWAADIWSKNFTVMSHRYDRNSLKDVPVSNLIAMPIISEINETTLLTAFVVTETLQNMRIDITTEFVMKTLRRAISLYLRSERWMVNKTAFLMDVSSLEQNYPSIAACSRLMRDTKIEKVREGLDLFIRITVRSAFVALNNSMTNSSRDDNDGDENDETIFSLDQDAV